MADVKQIALGNDYEVQISISAFDPLSKEIEGEDGRTVTALVAASPTGVAIHASLSVTLTDLADGDYHGVIQGADIDTNLTAYVGQVVYLRIVSGSSDLTGVVPLLVVNPRYLA